MAGKRKTSNDKLSVESFTHHDEQRRNIPTAEMQSMVASETEKSVQVAYQRRNRNLDPQLVWRGKDEQDKANLVVSASPLYIQEKVHPKALIDDLERETHRRKTDEEMNIPDLFEEFNGLSSAAAKTEFYKHDQNWSNRMILGDSLQVMTSLAEREQLQGRIQCIYIDPPFGIKFNSNFQWSTTSLSKRHSKKEYITREPEQVKAFRDTWRYGIHSYLAYLRDRFTVARHLLSETGSIFVQIGETNVHRVRILLDEVFGESNFVNLITCRVSSGTTRESSVKNISNYILWYCKDKNKIKFRRLLLRREINTQRYNQVEEANGLRRSMTNEEKRDPSKLPENSKVYRILPIDSMSSGKDESRSHLGLLWSTSSTRGWTHSKQGFFRLVKANRIQAGKSRLNSIYYHDDFPAMELNNIWHDTGPEINKTYVVQTAAKIVQRCVLMTTDPGDIVLDPTCGSGTSAYVAELWGRRWITIDTSRVALALARARIMGARYPYYFLLDSADGQHKREEVSSALPKLDRTHNSLRQGFLYKQVPRVTLEAIANNKKIDEIHHNFQSDVDDILGKLNRTLREHSVLFMPSRGARAGIEIDFEVADTTELPSGESIESHTLLEWEIPRVAPSDWPQSSTELLVELNSLLAKRQKEIERCITSDNEVSYFFDEPYEDNRKIRVAGPFTVESLTPHRIAEISPSVCASLYNDKPVTDENDSNKPVVGFRNQFTAIILEQLRVAGVQQTRKRNKIEFTSLRGWPGEYLCAEGHYQESEHLRRIGVLIGSEHGTVSRVDLIEAAREAAEAGFDVLLACAFNFDAQSTEINKLGQLPILKARMNSDLQMVNELKNTLGGNLFVIFGEPDIEIINGTGNLIQIRVKGVDLFDPRTGEVRSSEPDELACWFIDTNYNQESFHVRHAYFLGAKDPYQNLKKTLKSEIDSEAWQSLYSDLSRPFEKPTTGRIAVKAINHLGDEVLKVIRTN